MSRTVRVNATLDEDLLRRVDAFAEAHFEDRSTAIRQLIDAALRELSKRDAIEAYRAGRVTLREFARALGLEIWPAHDLLESEGVAIAQGDIGETRAALDAVAKSLKRKGGR